MKKILLFIGSILLFSGCSSKLTIEEIKNLMNENDYVIIDVRTRQEFEEEHLEGAINIAVDELSSSVFDKEKIIFVYCTSGNRSKSAYNFLQNSGYKVYDLGALSNIELPKEVGVVEVNGEE